MAEPARNRIPQEWIDAALEADAEWMRISRSVVFVSPARDQVRMMLHAAEPLIRAAERKRWEDRITLLESELKDARAAAAGYPEGSEAWKSMTSTAEALALALGIMKGDVQGEGLAL